MPASAATKWRRFCYKYCSNCCEFLRSFVDIREDTDRTFSYYSKQQVMIKDKWLGITNYMLQFLILVFVVGYVFLYTGGYNKVETANGAIATHVMGDTAASSSGKKGTRYFGTEDITYPGLENGNVFVTTRHRIYHQRRGVCEDRGMPCVVDTDCTRRTLGNCTDAGFCFEPSWCDQQDPELYELDVSNLEIWVKSSIQFVNLAPEKVYSTVFQHPYPERQFNAFTVRDILDLCVPPVRYEEISELGVAIEVMFNWHCRVTKAECRPKVSARRLDTIFDPENIGFGYSYQEYLSDDDRMKIDVKGVRFFFRTVGTGYKMSLTTIVTKASTSGSLLCVTTVIADLLMLKVFFHRDRYRARKFEVSPDFSDYVRQLVEKKASEKKKHQYDEEDAEHQAREEKWLRQLDEADD